MPPASATPVTPLEVKVELGTFLQRTQADQLVLQAQQHLLTKEPAKALAALRQAIQTDPTHAEARNSLAWLLLTGPQELRDAKEALSAARKAVELDPQHWHFQNTLGVALYRNDKLDEALTILEKSLKEGQGQSDAYDLFVLAMCHHRQADTDKAKDCRERTATWFAEHRAKLPPEQIEELKQFATEAEAVLSQPPGKNREGADMATESSGRFALLDQLVDEFAERYRRGERPSLQEYIERYPHLADAIRDYFPAVVQIEQVEKDCRPVTEPPVSLKQVGDYIILREVGRGGMGVVYEAEQQSLGRRVALKVLPVQVAGDGLALERFRREARAAAKLHHTNIVPVFEVGQAGDTCFYAMQFIHGQPLDQVVEELQRLRAASGGRQPPVGSGKQGADAPRSLGLGRVAESLLTGRFRAQELTTPAANEPFLPAPVSSTARLEPLASGPAVLPGHTDISSVESHRQPYFRSVAHIGQQVAHALAYAHQRGIVHRDIKPSNLLLDAAGVVWVTDFGLAKTDDEGLTHPGDILGTFRYMSPERFRGECDARADVYSLGLTLYEMLTLKPAFESSNRARLMEMVQHEEPARPRLVDSRIPRDLETIVLKATEKEPARRYATAEELAQDLQRFLNDEPIKARRTTVMERLGRWWRRNPVVGGLAATLALFVLAVAIGSTVAALGYRDALNESEQHRREADANLWEAYLAQARAGRMSRRVGQRFDSLDAIKRALALPLPPGHTRDELRNEAISCLALPDLRPVRKVPVCTWPGTEVVYQVSDGLPERCAWWTDWATSASAGSPTTRSCIVFPVSADRAISASASAMMASWRRYSPFRTPRSKSGGWTVPSPSSWPRIAR